MPTSLTVHMPSNTWVELTADDVTNITFDNVGGVDCWMKRGGETAPSSLAGALRIRPGTRGVNEDIDEVWPGLSGSRVWGYCYTDGAIAVQHA